MELPATSRDARASATVLRGYALGLLFAAVALAIRFFVQPWVGDQLPFVTFFAAIALAVWFGSAGAGALDAVALYATAYFFFFGPHYGFHWSAPMWIGLLVYVVASTTIIAITHRLRQLHIETQQTLRRAVESERRARLELAQRAQAEELLRTTQAQLAREVEDLTRLYQLSSKLDTLRGLDEQLHAILVSAVQAHGTDRGLLAIYDAPSGELAVRASLGFAPAALAALADVATATGASGLAFSEGRRVVVDNIDNDERFEMHRAITARFGIRAAHSVPLVAANGEVLGSLSVHFGAPHRPSRREMDQADLLARKAALYVQRARAEEARRESEQRLLEADRRKDEFLATLAHELRNPLAPIRNAVRFLQIKGSADPHLTNARELIDRQVRHMVRLVDDLLDVSRVTLGQIHLQNEVVSLRLLITNAVEASRPVLDAAQHQIVVALPDEPIYIEGDVTRLTQIFQNLLNNAAKYTPAGGRVEISSSRADACVRVAVRDNGIGIPPDMLERVFEMFAQAERPGTLARDGLGIGLSLAQRLAQMHGGRIEAHSEGEGRGSEFAVVLPTCAPRTLPKPEAFFEERTAPPLARRILIVDDNVDAAESLRMLIETQGHRARAAFDGDSALSVATEFRPEVVFLDLGMPKMDGYTVCRRLRSAPRGEELVIVALTGWGQDSDRTRTAAAGFDHHLVKPADPRLVERLICEMHASATVH